LLFPVFFCCLSRTKIILACIVWLITNQPIFALVISLINNFLNLTAVVIVETSYHGDKFGIGFPVQIFIGAVLPSVKPGNINLFQELV